MQASLQPPYLSLPTDQCFDHAFLSYKLRSYRSVRDKISLMLRHGEIIKLRRGLYALSRQYGGKVEPNEAANLIYGPSYISLEYALSYYGLIPERVEVVTSITSKRSKRFANPLGTFTYEHIPVKAYPVGIDLVKNGETGMFFASKEKALCDRIALASNIRTLTEIGQYIIENLRIDSDSIADFSLELLDEIERAYDLHRIGLFVKWYRSHFKRA
jgi:hypothetical protein